MVRKQEPHRESTEAAAPLPEGVSLEERTRCLIEELGSEAGFLEQWIVHYLAELLDTAEDGRSAPDARSQARAEIARVIPVLWEQQIEREAIRVRGEVDSWLRRADRLDPEVEKLLRRLLADPARAANVVEADVAGALRALHTLTELITRFLARTTPAELVKREVSSEAVQRFLRRDDDGQSLREGLARLIPDLAAVDPRDSAAVERVAHRALLTVTQAQLRLLNRQVAQDSE